MQVVPVLDLTINYEITIAEAIRIGGFTPFRVDPRLKDEATHVPKFTGTVRLYAQPFSVGVGYQIGDIPRIMEERLLRGPKDIREVLAYGVHVTEPEQLTIYAPELTGRADKLLRLWKYPEWKGLLIHTFDPDDENLWDLRFIGFDL